MANRVKDCRLKAHLSQEELAAASGLARPTISKIERNECEPSDLSKQKIADALGFPLAEVFPPTEAPQAVLTQALHRFGIYITNGDLALAGVRSAGEPGIVEVKDNRIEGFLVDQAGQRRSYMPVHLIRDGEKIDSTVSGREGRFVFKDLEMGEYIIYGADSVVPVDVRPNKEKFSFDL
ncbi:MAG TPA: helix-turn-helix transcriptional regulator [bacterium]|nr:helix-turn-helix transcriptional regulator [bacterium]